jgi:hypothetical protein
MAPARRLKFRLGTTEAAITEAIVEAGGFVPGSVVTLDVLHDDGCPKLTGGACRCEPEYQATINPPVTA